MANQINYDLRLFAEGVRIPVMGISRTQSNNGRFSMSIQIPPTPYALSVPPNTYFHAFVRQNRGADSEGTSTDGIQNQAFVLFGEGRMKTRGLGTDTDGGRYVVITCEGIEGDWAQFKLGFNIGQDANLNLPRLMRFFVGLSSGEGELFQGYDAAMAATSLAQITGGDRAPFLDFYLVLARLVEQMGPVSTIAHIISNLSAFSPLYKQLYVATKANKRIGFAENKKIGKYLGANVLLEAFLGRVQAMPNDASLFDLIQMLLPDTLHHYTHIASPWFNESALNNELQLTRQTEGELHPSLISSLRNPTPGGVAPPGVPASGGWIAPISTNPGTAAGNQVYGSPRPNRRDGTPRTHGGLDYPAPIGTPVYASRAGTVIFSGTADGYGTAIYLDHGDGYKTRYGHLSERKVEQDVTVQQGQVIGLSGNTGIGSGPHLHFEIRFNDKSTDPVPLLAGAASPVAATPDTPTPAAPATPAPAASSATPRRAASAPAAPARRPAAPAPPPLRASRPARRSLMRRLPSIALAALRGMNPLDPNNPARLERQATEARQAAARVEAARERVRIEAAAARDAARRSGTPRAAAATRASTTAAAAPRSATPVAPPAAAAGTRTSSGAVTPGAYNAGLTSSSSNAELARDPRIRAYLDVLARYESANGGSAPIDQQYRTLFGGGLFTDMSQHPWKGRNAPGGHSDSGRYQFLKTTWASVAAEAGITDFSPASQDLGAIQNIRRTGNALSRILSNDIVGATDQLKNQWYSLPPRGRGWRGGVGEVVTYYNTQVTAHSNGTAPLASGASGAAAGPGGATAGPLVQMHQLDWQYENMFGAVPQCIVKPQLDFAPPPLCNVVFGHQITNLQFIEDQRQAPTRLMVFGNPVVLRMLTVGTPERSSSIPLHFAPRYLRFLFDSLRGGAKSGDILSAEADGTANEAVQSYIDRIQESGGSDAVRLRDGDIEREIISVSRYNQAAVAAATQDAVQPVVDGSSAPQGSPKGLLGMYTYDELYRGVIPAVGKFPFLSDDAIAQAVDKETAEQLQGNARIAASSVPPDNPELIAQRDSAATVATQAVAEAASTSNPEAAGDEVANLVAAEEAVDAERDKKFGSIDLYASHQFAQMRRAGGQANITGPLNIGLVVGFSGAFHEPSIGWIMGTIESVSDSISVQGNATTTVQFSQCIPLSDYTDEVYSQFRIEADAESGNLRAAGLAENPAFLENKYSASQVGDTVYKPILGQGSIVDWYQAQLSGRAARVAGAGGGAQDTQEGLAGDLNVPSAGLALNEMLKRYNDADDKDEYVTRTLGRRIVTEKELMQKVLKGRPSDGSKILDGELAEKTYDHYWAGYDVGTELPTEAQSFMNQRADWAIEYAFDYFERDGTFSARAPQGDDTPTLDD